MGIPTALHTGWEYGWHGHYMVAIAPAMHVLGSILWLYLIGVTVTLLRPWKVVRKMPPQKMLTLIFYKINKICFTFKLYFKLKFPQKPCQSHWIKNEWNCYIYPIRTFIIILKWTNLLRTIYMCKYFIYKNVTHAKELL